MLAQEVAVSDDIGHGDVRNAGIEQEIKCLFDRAGTKLVMEEIREFLGKLSQPILEGRNHGALTILSLNKSEQV